MISTGSTIYDSVIETLLDNNKMTNMFSATAMTMDISKDFDEFMRKENIKRKQRDRRLKIKEIFSNKKSKQIKKNSNLNIF